MSSTITSYPSWFSVPQITLANSLRKTFPKTLNDPASIARQLEAEAEAQFLHSHQYMASVQSTLTEILQTENTLLLAIKADELASKLYHRTGKKEQTPQASALLRLLRKFSQDSIQRINVEHFVRRTSAYQLARPRFVMTGSLRGQSANLYRTLRMEITTLVKDTSAAVEIVGDLLADLAFAIVGDFKWVFASIRNYDAKDLDSTIYAVTLAEQLIDTWSTQFPALEQKTHPAVHFSIEVLTKFRDSVKALFRATGEEVGWTQENAQ